MRIIIQYKSQNTKEFITIKMFENPTATRWWQTQHSYALKKSVPKEYKLQLERWADHLEEYRKIIRVDYHWDQIKHSFSRIENLGFQMPFILPEKFNYDQQILNSIHRFFTYNAMWLSDLENDPNTVNPFDINFKFPKNMPPHYWTDIIVIINDAVHELEHVANPTPNKEYVDAHYPIYALEVLPTAHDDWMLFTEQEAKLQSTYFDHTADTLVLLNRSILGKPFIQSFYEHDNPTLKDCTGRLGSHGGFIIDVNDNRKKLYQSEKFKSWVESHNLDYDKLPLEFPIGYVEDSTKPLHYFFDHSKDFENVTWHL
jgi:hypothetical protein